MNKGFQEHHVIEMIGFLKPDRQGEFAEKLLDSTLESAKQNRKLRYIIVWVCLPLYVLITLALIVLVFINRNLSDTEKCSIIAGLASPIAFILKSFFTFEKIRIKH